MIRKFLPRKSWHIRGQTRIVHHTSLMSSVLEDTSPLPKIARSVTKVKGKTCVKNHKAPLSNIEEEVEGGHPHGAECAMMRHRPYVETDR